MPTSGDYMKMADQKDREAYKMYLDNERKKKAHENRMRANGFYVKIK